MLDTSELRWWLLGFGANVEVIAPQQLRAEFKAIGGQLDAIYDA